MCIRDRTTSSTRHATPGHSSPTTKTASRPSQPDHGQRSFFKAVGIRHGVLLVFGAPGQLKTLAGQEHGRTIPLTDITRAPLALTESHRDNVCSAIGPRETRSRVAVAERLFRRILGTQISQDRSISEPSKRRGNKDE